MVRSARTALGGAVVGLAAACLLSGCEPATFLSASLSRSSTSSANLYGNPTAAASYWQHQSLEDTCGLLSVADVIGELTGREPTERQIIALAEQTPSHINPGPIYPSSSGGGIEMADEVILLQQYGIRAELTDETHPSKVALTALQQYLADGRKIIAWVNSATIWNTSDQRTRADHFLVVTGIDTNNDVVHLNDSGAHRADEQVSRTVFTTAWQTGGDSIVVTAASGQASF